MSGLSAHKHPQFNDPSGFASRTRHHQQELTRFLTFEFLWQRDMDPAHSSQPLRGRWFGIKPDQLQAQVTPKHSIPNRNLIRNLPVVCQQFIQCRLLSHQFHPHVHPEPYSIGTKWMAWWVSHRFDVEMEKKFHIEFANLPLLSLQPLTVVVVVLFHSKSPICQHEYRFFYKTNHKTKLEKEITL